MLVRKSNNGDKYLTSQDTWQDGINVPKYWQFVPTKISVAVNVQVWRNVDDENDNNINEASNQEFEFWILQDFAPMNTNIFEVDGCSWSV